MPSAKKRRPAPQPQAVVALRARGLSLAEIGDKVGLTRQRVSQILKEAGARPAGTPQLGRGRPRAKPGHTGHAGPEAACPACRIRAARLSLALTQAQLAERLGVSTLTVRRWERVGPGQPGALAPNAAALQLAEVMARAEPLARPV